MYTGSFLGRQQRDYQDRYLPSPAHPDPKDALSSEHSSQKPMGMNPLLLAVKVLLAQIQLPRNPRHYISLLGCSHGEMSPLGPSSHKKAHPHFGGSPTKPHILPRWLAEGTWCSAPRAADPTLVNPAVGSAPLSQPSLQGSHLLCEHSLGPQHPMFTSASLVTKTISRVTPLWQAAPATPAGKGPGCCNKQSHWDGFCGQVLSTTASATVRACPQSKPATNL